MVSPVRLDSELLQQAELAGRLNKRSAPKQIEYWAEIGKTLENSLNAQDLIAISQGLATVHLQPVASPTLDPDHIFAELDMRRNSGSLSAAITQAQPYYQASRQRPGLLECVYADGHRETGHFQNGVFVTVVDN